MKAVTRRGWTKSLLEVLILIVMEDTHEGQRFSSN